MATPDPVEIVPYSTEWPETFSVLGRSLRDALGDVAVRIDHIGSTAVPGLSAKPIIDVQVSVSAFDPLDAYRRPLEHLGFVFRAENPELTKRYFRESPGTRRTHIHVRRSGSWAEQFALLFRDYLRAHTDDAKQYERLKRELADKYREDRHAYTEAKVPFIWGVMARADRWSQETGWEPRPSDA
ncbi:MAG: GrpB family protein [Bryobacteraceae bacterium]